MVSSLSVVVGLLTTALSLLTLVQQNPNLPQASRDSARQTAEAAIAQATTLIASSASPATTSNNVIEVDTEIGLKLSKITKTPSTAQISWTTAVPASSKVTITKTPITSNTKTAQFLPSANGISKQGLVSVSGLEQNTEYHYKIESTVGDTIDEIEGTFVTEKTAEQLRQEELAERGPAIYAEIEAIDKQCVRGCTTPIIERYRELHEELEALGESAFGCMYELKGALWQCTGRGG